MNVRQPALWWIGDTESAEIAPAYRDIQAWEAQQLGMFRTLPTATAALTALTRDPAPGLILLAASRPGEVTHEEIEALQQRAPLTRLLALLGSLCEGEQRTGRPWPGVLRYYWHQWTWRLKPLLQRWLDRHMSIAAEPARDDAPFAWELPLTATEDERCLAAAVRMPATAPAGSGLVAVAGHDAAMVETLVGICRQAGWHASAWSALPQYWHATEPPIATDSADIQQARTSPRGGSKCNHTWFPGLVAGIWDVCTVAQSDLPAFTAFARCLAPVPVVAVVNFPRWNDVSALQQAGATAVVSKPLYLGDLEAALDACVSGRMAGAS